MSILRRLKNVDFRRDDEFVSLGKLSQDLVLEITAKLLNVISGAPDEPFKTCKPPPSMSARYKMGAKLAESCQNLGFSALSDLGYQTFLYSNENDLRLVLMFLIDKLPHTSKDEDSEAMVQGKIKQLKSEKLRTNLEKSASMISFKLAASFQTCFQTLLMTQI